MIESLITLLAFLGFAVGGDAEQPYTAVLESDNLQINRVLDSNELKGFNSLEAHDADEWFV